jgi:hypothetical protein
MHYGASVPFDNISRNLAQIWTLDLMERTGDMWSPFMGEAVAVRGLALGSDRLSVATSLNEVCFAKTSYIFTNKDVRVDKNGVMELSLLVSACSRVARDVATSLSDA